MRRAREGPAGAAHEAERMERAIRHSRPDQVRRIEAAHGAMMQRFGYLTAHAAGV